MPARIHVLIGGHLSTAPRAQKEALALQQAGYEVQVSGIWFDAAAAARDELLIAQNGLPFRPALDFRGGSPRAETRRLRVRLRARWARARFARHGKFSPALLGYGAHELLSDALRENADLIVVHSEAGLWAGVELQRLGRKVGLDFEDWFSREIPGPSRDARRLEEMEKKIARSASYVLAPSQAMSLALAQAYGIRPPTVVYNAFPWAGGPPPRNGDVAGRQEKGVLSVHWFSQTIGPGRGLELLFAALALVRSSVRIRLRGHCSAAAQSWVEQQIPDSWRESVGILPLVSNAELPSRIAEHDVGLALEPVGIPCRSLTVSNKLFQYLQAGLAVIATDTPGQREVLSLCGEAGVLLPEESPQALARAIDDYAAQPEKLGRAQKAALAAAADPFAWERQQDRIVEQAARALASA
jgi:glycosyltransferase involved in cell wall biosynthesis